MGIGAGILICHPKFHTGYVKSGINIWKIYPCIFPSYEDRACSRMWLLVSLTGSTLHFFLAVCWDQCREDQLQDTLLHKLVWWEWCTGFNIRTYNRQVFVMCTIKVFSLCETQWVACLSLSQFSTLTASIERSLDGRYIRVLKAALDIKWWQHVLSRELWLFAHGRTEGCSEKDATSRAR